MTWRCRTCGETFKHWSKAERHADTTTHRRLDVVLEELAR